jgi:hypothetical protein
LVEAALKVLLEPDPWAKAAKCKEVVKLWREGSIVSIRPTHGGPLAIPDRPARADDKVEVAGRLSASMNAA